MCEGRGHPGVAQGTGVQAVDAPHPGVGGEGEREGVDHGDAVAGRGLADPLVQGEHAGSNRRARGAIFAMSG
ncbi:hypothetical protein ACFQX6_12000 [Streptosporangium lutulentum]